MSVRQTRFGVQREAVSEEQLEQQQQRFQEQLEQQRQQVRQRTVEQARQEGFEIDPEEVSVDLRGRRLVPEIQEEALEREKERLQEEQLKEAITEKSREIIEEEGVTSTVTTREDGEVVIRPEGRPPREKSLAERVKTEISPFAAAAIPEEKQQQALRGEKKAVQPAAEFSEDVFSGNLRLPKPEEVTSLEFAGGKAIQIVAGDVAGGVAESQPVQSVGDFGENIEEASREFPDPTGIVETSGAITGGTLQAVPGATEATITGIAGLPGGAASGVAAGTGAIQQATVGTLAPGEPQPTTEGPIGRQAVEEPGAVVEAAETAVPQAGESQIEFAREKPFETALIVGTVAAGPKVARGARRAVRGRTPDAVIDLRELTTERGARGEIQRFETSTRAPTVEAVQEVLARAKDQPEVIQRIMGQEEILFHTTEKSVPGRITVGEGASELPGMFVSPEPSPVGLRTTSFGVQRPSLSEVLTPRLPGLSGPDVAAALPGERVAGMPSRAIGAGYEVRVGGDVVARLPSRSGAKELASDIGGGAEVRPDITTPGARFLLTEAEPGTAFVRPRGSRTRELEAIFPPESRFLELPRSTNVDIIAGSRRVTVPGTELTFTFGGERIPLRFFERGIEQQTKTAAEIGDVGGAVRSASEIARETTPLESILSRRRAEAATVGEIGGLALSSGSIRSALSDLGVSPRPTTATSEATGIDLSELTATEPRRETTRPTTETDVTTDFTRTTRDLSRISGLSSRLSSVGRSISSGVTTGSGITTSRRTPITTTRRGTPTTTPTEVTTRPSPIPTPGTPLFPPRFPPSFGGRDKRKERDKVDFGFTEFQLEFDLPTVGEFTFDLGDDEDDDFTGGLTVI